MVNARNPSEAPLPAGPSAHHPAYAPYPQPSRADGYGTPAPHPYSPGPGAAEDPLFGELPGSYSDTHSAPTYAGEHAWQSYDYDSATQGGGGYGVTPFDGRTPAPSPYDPGTYQDATYAHPAGGHGTGLHDGVLAEQIGHPRPPGDDNDSWTGGNHSGGNHSGGNHSSASTDGGWSPESGRPSQAGWPADGGVHPAGTAGTVAGWETDHHFGAFQDVAPYGTGHFTPEVHAAGAPVGLRTEGGHLDTVLVPNVTDTFGAVPYATPTLADLSVPADAPWSGHGWSAAPADGPHRDRPDAVTTGSATAWGHPTEGMHAGIPAQGGPPRQPAGPGDGLDAHQDQWATVAWGDMHLLDPTYAGHPTNPGEATAPGEATVLSQGVPGPPQGVPAPPAEAVFAHAAAETLTATFPWNAVGTPEAAQVTGVPDHVDSDPSAALHGDTLGDGDMPGHAEEDGAATGTSRASSRSAASGRTGAGRGRRRSPRPKRSALLTVAVPSVAAMGVCAAAAASVTGMVGGSADAEDSTTQAAPDGATVTSAAANSRLDTQLAGVSAGADDFADRASRTQERIDLKQRQEAEKKRKAEEAARREALRPKFAMPVEQHGLSAYFGQAGVNWMSVHTGIDFPVSYGTKVMAATDGTVRTQYNSAYGNMAIVTAPDGTETWYCHLSSTRVRSGSVKAGDTIAYSGNSGNTTGPHMHFEVRPGGGSPIDPLPWLLKHGIDPR
ncbi:peptidoglycan DD-metalloendopeptidase family protein [Streptomyces sp. NPDC059740]|uniref:peptidoglycan DD-metalloendopeptidase family protein n=1 Tax=Streptomyces sp. NPDC059740 TaxID=3346926 RepID=UPI003647D69D